MRLLLVLACLLHAAASATPLWARSPLSDGARCDVDEVHKANRALATLLDELVDTTFFRLFRVGIDGKCPLTEPEDQELCAPVTPEGDEGECTLKPQDTSSHLPFVDRTISSGERTSLQQVETSCQDDFWVDMCDGLVSTSATQQGEFINLQLNPERHTGYNGSHVWRAIYDRVCFESTCHEERVLTRILSGLHASINTHIAVSFYPPKKGVREDWASNPELFVRTVGSHPDRVRNMHYAFVVMLRALRKAAPVLSKMSYAVGDATEDQRVVALVGRLLDSHHLSSCKSVFDAFDESLMFQERERGDALKKEFKRVFRAVSDLVNCVKCQKCRLHGKMQLAGVGAALKLLLVPEVTTETLTREELVAMFNTVQKLSKAISLVDSLNALAHVNKPAARSDAGVAQPSAVLALSVDQAIGVTAQAALAGLLTRAEEVDVLDLLLKRRDALAQTLAMHYASDPARFAHHVKRYCLVMPSSSSPSPSTSSSSAADEWDVVVVGSGLAGSTAALSLLDRGLRVAVLDKQAFLGGNSVMASSGINAVTEPDDSVAAFADDVARSAGRGSAFAESPLVLALTGDSRAGLEWIRTRAAQPFPVVGKLGGHSHARTHRPRTGMAGAELVYALHRELRKFEGEGRAAVLKEAAVDRLLADGDRIVGVALRGGREIRAKVAVVLATGGFAANASMLPAELRRFGTTNGPFATGDGIALATAVGADAVDLDEVQLHPTAFAAVRHGDRLDRAQPLCAEILRGVGGVLLDARGRRFCDEMGTRAYVSREMLARAPAEQDFVLVLSEAMAAQVPQHAPHYISRGLMTRFDSLEALARNMSVPVDALRSTLLEYEAAAAQERDEFGKRSFANAQGLATSPSYIAGRVQPALHYCMGGLRIDDRARVLRKDGSWIEGLLAAGEVTGGIHGGNRLGGNGMTECVVFGRRAAAEATLAGQSSTHASATRFAAASQASKQKATVTLDELKTHASRSDCWVAVDGLVYDFTAFLPEHPAGAQAILDVAGTDATALYKEIHSMAFLEDFAPVAVLAAT